MQVTCIIGREENQHQQTSKLPGQTEKVQMVYKPYATGQDMSSARGQSAYQLKEYATVICIEYKLQFYSDSSSQYCFFQRSFPAITNLTPLVSKPKVSVARNDGRTK